MNVVRGGGQAGRIRVPVENPRDRGRHTTRRDGPADRLKPGIDRLANQIRKHHARGPQPARLVQPIGIEPDVQQL